jgi:hypothetical protein
VGQKKGDSVFCLDATNITLSKSNNKKGIAFSRGQVHVGDQVQYPTHATVEVHMCTPI